MSQTEIGIIFFLLLVFLVLIGMHVGFTMVFIGMIGFAMIGGWDAGISNAGLMAWDRLNNYDFAPLPLFLLMGAFVAEGQIGKDAYEMARAWFGQLKGGLAMATIGASGLFAAICGTSLAGSLVMGKVAYPEMRRLGYKMSLAAGTVSVGGTLGILIPPSMGFIMIGILTGLSIGQLFMAGIIPGILVILFYMGTIYIQSRFNPGIAPSLPATSWAEKIKSVRLTWPVVLLFLLVMGGIYGGIFTATEAGAIGAFGALIISVSKRQMDGKRFWNSLMDTGKMTAIIAIMLIGAFTFNGFLAITQIPSTFSEFLIALPVSRWVVLGAILVFYIICGMFFDVLAILILTIPIMYPAVHAMHFDLIWYSVLMVRIIEIGEISPPYGINLFGLLGVIDAPLTQIYRGVVPFLIADVLNIVVLALFPVICTFLPYTLR